MNNHFLVVQLSKYGYNVDDIAFLLSMKKEDVGKVLADERGKDD